MAGIESVNEGLFFAASQSVGTQQAFGAQKKEKTSETKKTSFSSIFQKTQEQQTLINEGLPPEIAGMSKEDAAVYLRDQAEIAGDKLKKSIMPENFADYRKKVSWLLKFIEKNNFDFHMTVKARTRRGVMLQPKYQIQVIQKELDDMAKRFLIGQKDQLEMLKKVEEINGMIVDLLAS